MPSCLICGMLLIMINIFIKSASRTNKILVSIIVESIVTSNEAEPLLPELSVRSGNIMYKQVSEICYYYC